MLPRNRLPWRLGICCTQSLAEGGLWDAGKHDRFTAQHSEPWSINSLSLEVCAVHSHGCHNMTGRVWVRGLAWQGKSTFTQRWERISTLTSWEISWWMYGKHGGNGSLGSTTPFLMHPRGWDLDSQVKWRACWVRSMGLGCPFLLPLCFTALQRLGS